MFARLFNLISGHYIPTAVVVRVVVLCMIVGYYFSFEVVVVFIAVSSVIFVVFFLNSNPSMMMNLCMYMRVHDIDVTTFK